MYNAKIKETPLPLKHYSLFFGYNQIQINYMHLINSQVVSEYYTILQNIVYLK